MKPQVCSFFLPDGLSQDSSLSEVFDYCDDRWPDDREFAMEEFALIIITMLGYNETGIWLRRNSEHYSGLERFEDWVDYCISEVA